MSKMDRILNSKKDKETIYEIYRACRLCGAGAGYKMPIIQNVVDLDDTDVELKQKIRECVQIEVDQDDKMPPLICELCVDKVNDFYEFLEMCRQTNMKTRLRLGLPPQSLPRGAPDAGDCILGLTEPVYVEDSDGEPLAKHKKMQPKVKVKKEPEQKVKAENKTLTDTRSSRHNSRRRSPTPPRITRHSKHNKEDNVSLSKLQDKSKSPRTTPKSILKREKERSKSEDISLLTPRLKRTRDREPVKLETPVKKVKIALKSSPSLRPTPKSSPHPTPKPSSHSTPRRSPHPTPKPSPHPTPKSSPKASPRLRQLSKSPKIAQKRSLSPLKRPRSPPRHFKCVVCGSDRKTLHSLANHMKVHSANFTNPKNACNPCGLWWQTSDEAAAHHRYHRNKSKPYTCKRCTGAFKHLSAFDEHFDKNQCIPYEDVPDLKCDSCWRLFATNRLLDDHKCYGEENRPGGKCSKCNKSYALLKNLKRHEQTCTAKKKGELIVDPVLLGKLKPIQVRVSRCDPLLTNIKEEKHYDVSNITDEFGLDKKCVYPYISSVTSLSIKSEPDFEGMVAIKDEVKDEFCSEEFVHWDEDSDSDDSDISCSLILSPFANKKKKIDTLATLTLKTLFSQKYLGKVPRKRRKVKQEKSVFDSLLNNEDDVSTDISNIIDNLGDGENSEKIGDVSIDITDDKVSSNDNITDVDKSGDIDKTGDDEKVADGDETDAEDDTITDDKDTGDLEKVTGDDSKSGDNDEKLTGDNKKSADEVDKSTEDTVHKSSEIVNEKSTDDKISDNKITIDGDSTHNDVSMFESDDSVKKNDQIDYNLSKTDGGANDSAGIMLENDKSSDVVGEKDQNEVLDEKDVNGATNDENGSNNDLSDNVKDNNDDLDDKVNVKGTVNNVSEENNVAKVVSSRDESKLNDVSKNDDSSPKNEGSANNDLGNSEDLLNENTESDLTSRNGKDFKNNNELSEQKKSYNDISLENLNSESKISDLNLLDSKTNNISNTQNNDANDKTSNDSKTNDNAAKDSKSPVSVIFNQEKAKNSNDEEMDDSKLMAELDAQIGENNGTNKPNDNYNDNIDLEENISGKNSEKTIELDIIPDEFHLDT